MVDYFDARMRDGETPQALVVDGQGLHWSMSHPPGDPFYQNKNTDILGNYLVDAVALLQMLCLCGSHQASLPPG
eukprot:1688027-Prorocentrum_lima.AAC.1